MAEEVLSVGVSGTERAVTRGTSSRPTRADGFARERRRGAWFQARLAVAGIDAAIPVAADAETDHLADVIPLHPGVSRPWRIGKRALDIGGACVLLALATPIMLVVAALLALQGGPVLFRQRRVGLHGRQIRICKFRSMIPNAEAVLADLLQSDAALREEWEHTQKLQHDPRITAFGRFLRRTSIDELPQLFNVLAGSMSLVGPRPVLEDELERYGNAARWYRAVKPGITGLWQVNGRNSTEYGRRIALDVHYVRAQGPALDLRILLRTVYVVLWRIGAH